MVCFIEHCKQPGTTVGHTHVIDGANIHVRVSECCVLIMLSIHVIYLSVWSMCTYNVSIFIEAKPGKIKQKIINNCNAEGRKYLYTTYKVQSLNFK